MIAYERFTGFITLGYFFKTILSFRCHCHLVEYPTMPLTTCFTWMCVVSAHAQFSPMVSELFDG